MIGIEFLLTLIVAHYVADFVFQTEKMATRKSYSVFWLTAHVLTYTTVLAIFTVWYWPMQYFIFWIITNGVLHWFTDFTTSRLNAEYQKRGEVNAFWNCIGADQAIHHICLVLTTYFFLIV